MLRESKIWDKYQKWLGGINKINERINALDEEKKSINDQINDDIEDTPGEMVNLHTRLHHIDREIESAKAIVAEFKAKKPFTEEEFYDGYQSDAKNLAKVLGDSSERLKKARAELREALSEYLKAYDLYSNDYSLNHSKWESIFREVGYDAIRMRLRCNDKEPDLTDQCAKEVSIGFVHRGDNTPRAREVLESD
jgi:DNA repair exonuclease SbcCD ATPase subunit